MFNPDEDGITHINIYSKGKTGLGRMLTNFHHSEFHYEPYGTFQSVEGFWYYYLTGCQHEQFKTLYGWFAKKEGQRHRDDRLDKEGLTETNKEIILEAIRCKLRQNKDILLALSVSSLPLVHYYYWGDSESGYRIKLLPEYDWIVEELERIRKLMKGK